MDTFNEDIWKRLATSHNDPIVIGTQKIYRVKFSDPTLPTKSLLLPEDYIEIIEEDFNNFLS